MKQKLNALRNMLKVALTEGEIPPIINVTYKFLPNLHATNHNSITSTGDDQAMTHAKIRYTTQTIHKLFCISHMPKKKPLLKKAGEVDHFANYAFCNYVQKSLRSPSHALNTPPSYHDLAAA